MTKDESSDAPIVFISYSWDSVNHRKWVSDFASRLKGEGIRIILDYWDAVPGDQLPVFMERAVRDSDFVLCVCTPKYKKKSDGRGGGVGYEGDIMTAEAFVKGNIRKFIPVLRDGKWEDAAPSWLLGKYYIDLRNDSNFNFNYKDLLAALCGKPKVTSSLLDSDFEFVNREIELATLNPAKIKESYWQSALVSAPAGYGKSHLLKHLRDIQIGVELDNQMNCCYLDLDECANPVVVIDFIAEKITNEPVTRDLDDEKLKNKVCYYILETMRAPKNNGKFRSVLLLIDSIDCLTPAAIKWLSSIIQTVIIGAYMNPETNSISFPVKVILAGVDTDSFWNKYLSWEGTSGKEYRLKPPMRLPLSAFDELAVQDLISRKAEKKGITLKSSDISFISRELQYLSGGHPQVVSKISDELVANVFNHYKIYLKDNRKQLVRKHISEVTKKILRNYHLPQQQKDIKTICVFRIIDLNTLQALIDAELVLPENDIGILSSLQKNKVLNPPNANTPFYHDDIIRRILYLDLTYRSGDNRDHVQKTHLCAKALYQEWIELRPDLRIYFFTEWLFHVLQIIELTKDEIIQEWSEMLSRIQSTSLPLGDLKRAIREKLETDNEIKYHFREHFDAVDYSPLFDEEA
jgi:hypothetical protein